MKKMLLTLMAMVTMTISAQAMTFNEARREAFFLTDKMAYELNLSNAQYEAVYEINLDYLTALAVSDDIFGFYWERRNEDLSFVLSSYQYRTFMAPPSLLLCTSEPLCHLHRRSQLAQQRQ